ncbi:MAG: DUF389 domain-containing protein [Marinifilaceae bacterium]
MSGRIKHFLWNRLSVLHEKENESDIIDIISKGVVFQGANLWVLIFAVFIASLGLNINSTAVIIGAMLISPLMGPIMGFGVGVGINDFELLKRSGRNFLIATVFSVLTSTIYFLISPISEAQSELLARTQPTIYDVMIAFFGGGAGMLAVSIKQKGNVIPGVAIATALMPPLCTAGFGIATGNWMYFIGAFYLYFINTVFISLATLIVVRLLRYKKLSLLDPNKNKKVTRYIGTIVICTLLPSLYLSYKMIETNYLQARITSFVNNELQFPHTQIVSKKIEEKGDSTYLDVIMLGNTIPEIMIQNAQSQMAKYRLKRVKLSITQGINQGDTQTDMYQLKSMVLTDLYQMREKTLDETLQQMDSLKKQLQTYQTMSNMGKTILPELRIFFPQVTSIFVDYGELVEVTNGSEQKVLLVYVESTLPLNEVEQSKLREWLAARMGADKVKLIVGK